MQNGFSLLENLTAYITVNNVGEQTTVILISFQAISYGFRNEL